MGSFLFYQSQIMAKLISFHKIGENKEKPRIWLESKRLETHGFSPGTPFSITQTHNGMSIQLSGNRTVSSRRIAGGTRPIIEISASDLFSNLKGIETIRAKASYGKIDISPSIQAFLIKKARAHKPPFSTVEIFAGGGTLSEALKHNPHFHLKAGVELDPTFADIWSKRHPNATLFQSDIRLLHPAELPRFDVLIGGIPCTSFSNMGRAKKQLAGRPEEGDTGDLFLNVFQLVSYHMPRCCIFENVPSFSTSLAGNVLKSALQHLGYHLSETILEPLNEWNEPSDRKRWCLIATLDGPMPLQSPNSPFAETIEKFLNPEMETDQQEAARIANTIEGLKKHNERHAKLGHGFAMTHIHRKSEKIPTIPKSYHKINTGPFVETPWGPRMLQLEEVERIMGCNAGTDHYATGIQVLGQGVQTRIWQKILEQVGTFLANPIANHLPINQPSQPEFLFD